jgi:hypothetical protein
LGSGLASGKLRAKLDDGGVSERRIRRVNLEPFLDQADDARVADSMPQEALQTIAGKLRQNDRMSASSMRGQVDRSCVEPLEEADELTRTMAIVAAGMHLAREQVDPGKQAQRRAMAFVFMIAREPGVRLRLREIGRAAADCLDTRLLVIRDDRDIGLAILVRPQDQKRCSPSGDVRFPRRARGEAPAAAALNMCISTLP